MLINRPSMLLFATVALTLLSHAGCNATNPSTTRDIGLSPAELEFPVQIIWRTMEDDMVRIGACEPMATPQTRNCPGLTPSDSMPFADYRESLQRIVLAERDSFDQSTPDDPYTVENPAQYLTSEERDRVEAIISKLDSAQDLVLDDGMKDYLLALQPFAKVQAPDGSIVAGAYSACALDAERQAYCWGSNGYGQMGNGLHGQSQPAPKPVSGGKAFRSLGVGRWHTCGLTTDDKAYCWGRNGDGELGSGNRDEHLEPTPVAGDLSFKSLVVGDFHACAIGPEDHAYCWGSDRYGSYQETPAVVSNELRFTQLSAGYGHTCGLTSDGSAYCWGGNGSGQFGDGTRTGSMSPVAVATALKFAMITAGGDHTCALVAGGKAYCWGRAYQNADPERMRPTVVPEGYMSGTQLSFTTLSAGASHTCGLTANGKAYCWGSRVYGALGHADSDDYRSEPSPVAGSLRFKSISSDDGLSCGITISGQAFCWGRSNYGQVGDGRTLRAVTPARVVDGPNPWGPRAD